MSDKFRVLISDEMSDRAAEILAASPAVEVDVRFGLTAGDLKATIGEYDGLLVRSRSKVGADVIEAGKRLKIIGRAGIGVDNIDVAAASRRGIIVMNTPSGNAVTTAEHALCLLMSLARHIPQATASIKAGKWDKNKFSGTEIMGKSLGVIGMGNIGRIVADRARGLKMKVLAYDPFIGREAAARLGVELVDMDELLARADFITVHTPLTNETRGMIGAAAMARTKRGVLVVNAARGGIVDEDARSPRSSRATSAARRWTCSSRSRPRRAARWSRTRGSSARRTWARRPTRRRSTWRSRWPSRSWTS